MSRFITCGLMILLAFAPAALAVDGIVLINQSTITTGLPGCPPGVGFLISICQSGSYRLSGNITVPDANTLAIAILADNVSLDLNGFAILGPVTCKPGTYPVQCSATGSGTGILSTHDNISLSNGAVNGVGGIGVALVGKGVRIDGLRVANNAGEYGILADYAVISNCTVTTNAGTGISVIFGGTVNHSLASFNGGIGINGAGALVVSNSSVLNNGQDGMNNVLLAVNNTIIGNVGFGFSCADNSCSFEGNVFQQPNGRVVSGGTSLGHNSSNGVVF